MQRKKAIVDDLKGPALSLIFLMVRGVIWWAGNMYVQLSKLEKTYPRSRWQQKTCLAMIQKRCRRWIS